MAEPARKFDDNPVPGNADSAPPGRPELKALEGGGETSQPKTGHLSEAEEGSSPPESTLGHEGQLGRGYISNSTNKPRSKFLGRFSRRQKTLGGIGAGLIGAGLISFLVLFLPALRLEGYMANINNRVFAAANNAVQQRTEKLFERFMITRLLGMDKCGGVVSSGCRVNYANMGLASNLFNSWQDARVEDKLINEYGFSFVSRPNPAPGQPRFIVTDKAGNEIKLSSSDVNNGNFLKGNRAMGKEINAGLKEATRWDQVLQRRSIRKYLTRKHGVKFWCFFACNQKDAIDNAKISAKTKLQYKLLERVVYPFTPKYALIMKCLASGDPGVCSPDNLNKASLDTSALSDKDLQDLQAFSQKLEREPGLKFSQVVIEQTLIKAGMDEGTAKAAASAVPLAGQIYLALSALEAMETVKHFVVSGDINKIAANLTALQYVEYYSAMRSANDEIKAGALPADEVGALNSQFDDGNLPAEQSRVYQAYNNTGSSVAAGPSLIASLVTPKALAAAINQTATYTCSNGQPLAQGQLVCPEKTLNNNGNQITDFFDSSTTKTIVDGLDQYDKCYGISVGGTCAGLNPHVEVHQALGAVNWLINGALGPILSVAFDALKVLPGISNLFNFATNEAGKLIIAIFNQAFPLPVQPNSSGIDKYNALEAGGELTASEFNKGGYTDSGQAYGLGGRLLTPQEQTGATQAYLDQQNYDNSHGSLISRMASIDNPNSLLSRFVAIMPTTWSQFSASATAFIANPFGHMGSIFHQAYAATTATDINAFGIPRFGYTANDPAFDADPAIYTPEYCQQLQQKWEASKTQDPVTGIDEYSFTNPCLLEQVSIEAASSVITNNDSLDQ